MLNYYLYRIGQFIALHLPLKVGYAIAVFCSDLHYLFAAKDRKAVKENLKTIFPDKTEGQVCKIRLRMFRNFAKYLVDFFRFEKLDLELIQQKIRIENLHYFKEAFSAAKGIVVLTAHLGNWELGGVVISLLGYPLWVVALAHKHKKVDIFFNAQRENKGLKVIPLGKAVKACLNLLKENKMVALVGDRDFTENGVLVNFFGKDTYFPQGPAALSLKTGAIIVPGFMVRNPDDTFTLKIEKPISFNATGNKERDLRDMTNLYKKIFEDYIRRYPDQWYMFKRFWVARREG